MHFERMAAEYAGARPPYPTGMYELLESEGVIGRGVRVLEVGAGSGLATRDLVCAGCAVTAVEPGRELARLLQQDVPEADARLARRLHMLAHMLRKAIGTTGTARRSRIFSTPPLNGAMLPSFVSAPSGKMQTSSPSARVASISSNARCINAGSSRAPAIGIALAVRKIQRMTGMLKIR